MKTKQMWRFFAILIMRDKIRAISLWPFGIYTREKRETIYTVNHESVHWRQQIEMLGIFFYLWYCFEWVVKLFKYGRMAYYAISFEREAYSKEHDLEYLKNRKPFAWIHYL